MLIGGLQKFSLLDYPGNIAAIIFTQGCNFQCQYCYNPMLVWPREPKKLKQKGHHSFTHLPQQGASGQVKEDDLFVFLGKRKGKLDAVVITGGEPTIHKDLEDFIARIKKMGFKVKLDTNGANPNVLKKLIDKKLLDYIAMDIKAPAKKYKKIVGKQIDFKKIEKSVKIIIESKLPYEFRTTVVPDLLNKDDIVRIAKLIRGANILYLQQIKQDTDLVNQRLRKVKPYTKKELLAMCQVAGQYVGKCGVR